MRIFAAGLTLLTAIGGLMFLAPARETSGAVVRASDKPVLVELYQSQGCSSCPPANANLNAIADRADVIALSFGVTYWDYLGWKDSFARPEFTRRQRDYARYNRLPHVATPQVWINGRTTIVGYDRRELERSIQTASRGGPSLKMHADKVEIGAARAPSGGADVWVARFDPRTIAVPIRAGENGGRTLPHRNIVRQLVKVGHWTGTGGTFRLPRAHSGLSTAVFLQAGVGGPVIAAAKS